MKHVFVWVEIPVTDIHRAMRFYGALLEQTLELGDDGVRKFAVFTREEGGVGGSLTQATGFEPSADGVLAYIDGGADLSVMLSRVEPAGGKVVIPKTSMGGSGGYYATFRDTEGNTLALYSVG
ncbi:MAG: VOC family protein [Anaerolineae bacterium]